MRRRPIRPAVTVGMGPWARNAALTDSIRRGEPTVSPAAMLIERRSPVVG
ncbi:hypothetical protein RKD41_006743 [Streptomyces tendae]